MWLSRLKALSGFFLAAILFVPAWAANSPQPGTLNYIEGHATIGATALNSKSVGSAELQQGQTLTTGNGKAELLLTPGVYLRVGDDSSVKMVSPDLAYTQVAVNSGHAMVEVDEIHKANNISVLEDGATIRLNKTGLYDFDAAQNQVRVFKGQALVLNDDRTVKLGGGRQITLNSSGKLKATKFDKQADEDSLYRFSELRSDYLADANINAAQLYVAEPWYYGPGWFGPGWFWDSGFSCFTFIPAGGVFYSPFGYPFFSPVIVREYPLAFGPYGYYGPYGFYGVRHGFVNDGDHDRDDQPSVALNHGALPGSHVAVPGNHVPLPGGVRGPVPGHPGAVGAARGPAMSGFRGASGFHGSSGMAFHGGGFQGGGGFHGGGSHR